MLRRNDIHGIRLVARAIPAAEDLLNARLDHLDHLHDAVVNYLMPDWLGQVGGIVDDFLILCNALAQDPYPTTATAARELAGWARP
ncbi:hypothetical protein Afe04nite_20470 [Asanoa ferruginea]|nr:hypothetical protein Afe04nite_20470 [Asanoa ferruginea]